MPTVSVIIPTYRHRQFISDAIQSVFAQTFTDYELIVVDDGSPDDTELLIKPLVDAGKLRYIRQDNAGQAAARNLGIAQSSGEFIAFLDDDDIWPPDKLAWQIEMMLACDWVAVGGSCSVFGEGRQSPPAFGPTRELVLIDLFDGNPFHSPGQVMVRRKALLTIGNFDPSVWGVEDLDLYIRLANCGTIGAVDRQALCYRVHSGNASDQLERMFRNGTAVIRKNLKLLPTMEQALARRNAYRWLYRYSGARIVRNALHSFSFRKWFAAVSVWSTLALPACLDSRLLRALIWEMLPQFVRHKFETQTAVPAS